MQSTEQTRLLRDVTVCRKQARARTHLDARMENKTFDPEIVQTQFEPFNKNPSLSPPKSQLNVGECSPLADERSVVISAALTNRLTLFSSRC